MKDDDVKPRVILLAATFALTFLLFIVLVVIGLTGESTGYVEIATPEGIAFIAKPKESIDSALKNPVEINAADGTIITVHFVCTDCEHDETAEIIAPGTMVFHCDCEYSKFISVNLSISPNSEEASSDE